MFPDIWFQSISTERRVGQPQAFKLGTEQNREAKRGLEKARTSDGMGRDSLWMDECSKQFSLCTDFSAI